MNPESRLPPSFIVAEVPVLGSRFMASRRSARLNTPTTTSARSALNTNMTAEEHAESIMGAIASRRDPVRAESMSKYLRWKFEFLGVATPVRRELQRPGLDLIRIASGSSPGLALDVCDVLWQRPEREAQLCGVDILGHCRLYWPLVGGEVSVTRLERFFLSRAWWDTIDFLSSHAVLAAHNVHPAAVEEAVERWSTSDDMWTRRVSLLWQLRRKEKTNEEILFQCIEGNIADDDFFIRKAIGWALREYRKTARSAVDVFVQNHSNVMSKLSTREALKHR